MNEEGNTRGTRRYVALDIHKHYCVVAGVDSVWEQKKPEARKMLENAAESPASSTRCVRWLFTALFDNGGKLYHC